MARTSKVAPGSLDEIRADWETRDVGQWKKGPHRYVAYGKRAMELGHASLAFDIFKTGLLEFGDDAEMAYAAELALARGGSITNAAQLLSPLVASLDDTDLLFADVFSLAGRLAKDRWARLSEPDERRTEAARSAELYARAFAVDHDYYPGINAATMNLAAGNDQQAQFIAEQVREICVEAYDSGRTRDHWIAATLGEVSLLIGARKDAVQWYETAMDFAGNRYGDIASMRGQIKYLSRMLDVDKAVLRTLDVPRIINFTGHMVDTEGRVPPRFPPDMEPDVRIAIAAALDGLDARIGYCSAACGADILFIECMLERGAEVHILLPFAVQDFIATSVGFAGDAWVDRFEAALAGATSVKFATEEGYLDDDALFTYNGDLISGLAILHANQLESEPFLLAIVESEPDQKLGGTLDTMHRWQAFGRSAEIVSLREIREARPANFAPTDAAQRTVERSNLASNDQSLARRLHRHVRTMLFADVVGFSKLGEEAAPSFFVDFLNVVADTIHTNNVKPVFSNTWGDGLFLVFEDLVGAADFALHLRDRIVGQDWTAVGLPEDTTIRIGMHTGPVFEADDPILGKKNFYGSHVNRAARIEPVTTPGSVFVSEQTACLLVASECTRFAVDYLGQIPLAKQYGSGSLYRLRRSAEVE